MELVTLVLHMDTMPKVNMAQRTSILRIMAENKKMKKLHLKISSS